MRRTAERGASGFSIRPVNTARSVDPGRRVHKRSHDAHTSTPRTAWLPSWRGTSRFFELLTSMGDRATSAIDALMLFKGGRGAGARDWSGCCLAQLGVVRRAGLENPTSGSTEGRAHGALSENVATLRTLRKVAGVFNPRYAHPDRMIPPRLRRRQEEPQRTPWGSRRKSGR